MRPTSVAPLSRSPGLSPAEYRCVDPLARGCAYPAVALDPAAEKRQRVCADMIFAEDLHLRSGVRQPIGDEVSNAFVALNHHRPAID